MSATQVACPGCGTMMDSTASFCPGCDRPRTAVREELEKKAQRSGRPYEEWLADELYKDKLKRGVIAAPMRPVKEPTPEEPLDGPRIDFDNQSQMERIQAGLIPGETLFAVYDMKGGGSGFMGLTNKRLVIQDEGRIQKRRSLISIPYSQIAMVSAADEGGLFRATSNLTLITASGQTFDLDFRSGDKAHRAYNIIISHF